MNRMLVGLGSLILSSLAVAKSSESKTSLTPREIFRKTAGQWSGDIFLLPKKGNYMLETREFEPRFWHKSHLKGELIPAHPKSTHGVAWDYDLKIPIVFYDPSGRWINAGQFEELAVQQDIAPTLASILDIPPPAKHGGRVLKSALSSRQSATRKPPKVIVTFVQDQMGRQYLAAHPGRAKFYESLIAKGAHFKNASVAHVDVETSVGHAAVSTGTWPSEHGVAGNYFFHGGLWRQIAALGIQLGPDASSKSPNPNFLFSPTLSDVWSIARKNKPVILAVAPVPRAAIAMGGHGALFKDSAKTYVTWMNQFGSDGSWTTEEGNYQLPSSFKGQLIEPWVKDIVDKEGRWYGHLLVKSGEKSKEVDDDLISATPAAVHQQSALTLKAIEELKIGIDEETDLLWLNTKATDFCGHAFGYESDECGDVLTAADDAAKKIIDLVEKQSGGDFMVVLTADHGAAPMPELSGAYRIDKSKLRSDLNSTFDKRDNNIEAIQVVTSSQIYVNEGELMANGFTMQDVAKYLRSYKAKMDLPFNARHEFWLKKGKLRDAVFFEDVVLKSDLKPM